MLIEDIEKSALIAGQWHQSSGNTFNSWDPAKNCAIQEYSSATSDHVEQAMSAATAAAEELRAKSADDIANFLYTIADEIEALGSTLIETGQAETGLPEARLLGERGRTCGQIRAFAELAAKSEWVQATIDTAIPDREPLPKPDIRSTLAPIGPVVVFGASNFPFAFGAVGGDTASALAAGNPVIVKGHSSHPGTSALFAYAVNKAIEICNFPAGTFSLLQGSGHQLGSSLVAHPAATAVGFTGSVGGGRALMDIAAARAKPISVYAEMGSVNPVFVMPDAIANRSADIAAGLASSVAMGVGQFCTSPGLVVTLEGHLASQLAEQLSQQSTGTMLNPGIASSYQSMVAERATDANIDVLTGGADAENPLQPKLTLMKTSAAHFLATPDLLEEIFGPATLLVECHNMDELQTVASHIEGNLTATIHTDNAADPAVATLLSTLAHTTGRVLFNGYPTGVEVCPSMHHGGPYPASSTASATSVGTAAITRFVKRTAFQNCPDSLLPTALQNANPLNIFRQVNGEFTRAPVNGSE